MIYFNKHITQSALISCIFCTKIAIITAEPKINKIEKHIPIISLSINSKQKNTKFFSHNTSSADKITVIKKNELKFVDGYKININGKHSTYFYGYINGYENGKLYGFLYNKKGQPIYFYGSNANDDKKSIYVHDQQFGIYILNHKKTKNNTTKGRK